MGVGDGKKRGSRYRSTESDLEADTGLPDDVTLEELDERARRVAKALMGYKPETQEVLKERRKDR